MATEKLGATEQTINKIAEVALARILDTNSLSVRIKTDLNKLARGEIEAIAIDMYGLLLQQNLRVEELTFNIGQVTVRPRKAMFGKVELVHPSEGRLRLVLNGDQLTAALNSKSWHPQDSQSIEQIKCELTADGAIALNCQWKSNLAEEISHSTLITTPRIEADGTAVVLDIKTAEGQDLPSWIMTALLMQISNILSLRDLANRGTVLHIQQLDVITGSIMVQANAYIEQVPFA